MGVNSSYIVKNDDEGKLLRVLINYKDNQNFEENLTVKSDYGIGYVDLSENEKYLPAWQNFSDPINPSIQKLSGATEFEGKSYLLIKIKNLLVLQVQTQKLDYILARL